MQKKMCLLTCLQELDEGFLYLFSATTSCINLLSSKLILMFSFHCNFDLDYNKVALIAYFIYCINIVTYEN